MTTTGQRLAAAMKEANVSASQLAREIGVSRAAVSLWLHDKTNLTAENAKQAARILDVSPSWLIDGLMKTPSGEWLELTQLEFEVIKVLRKYENAGTPEKAVLKQYLSTDGSIIIGE